MAYDYDYVVFIGRFQPFHKGHYEVVQHALQRGREVILVVGSHDSPRTIRNPFTFQERKDIILSCFTDLSMAVARERLHFAPQPDYVYNETKWVASVQGAVSAIVNKDWKAGPIKIALIGYEKDHSSYYLKLFPMWDSIDIKLQDTVKFNSTDIRDRLFGGQASIAYQYRFDEQWFVGGYKADHFKTFLSIILYPQFDQLRSEFKFIQNYKKQWADSPYPVTFNTVDALVVQSGHVLLVKRKAAPGRGLYALPGGFLEQTETLEEAMMREVYEETRLDVPKPVLKGNIERVHTYDAPHRSDRGRTITTCFFISLRGATKLPKIKGSSDAEKAFWMPLAEVMKNRAKFFEDHYSIIEHMLGL